MLGNIRPSSSPVRLLGPLLLLLTLNGCRCGQPPDPVLTVHPDGAMQLEEGRLAPVAANERLGVLSSERERVSARQMAEIIVQDAAGKEPGLPRPVLLRCAPMGGLAPGRYPVQRITEPNNASCERWGEVADPKAPTVKVTPGLTLPPATFLRIIRPRPTGGETILWGRLGEPVPEQSNHFRFELLLPLDPPPLLAGEAVDLGDPDGSGKGLGPAVAGAARSMAAEALANALDAYAVALDNPEPQRAAAELFALADRGAERAGELTAGEVNQGKQGDLTTPATVWTRWIGELEKRISEAGPRKGPRWEPTVQVVSAHLPVLEKQAGTQKERWDDLERLRILLLLDHPPTPPGEGTPKHPSPPVAPPKKKLEYLELEQMPEELKAEYQAVRAIPVNADPARFADRNVEELRQEQVAPLLEHAEVYVRKASDLVQTKKQAPDPKLTCRIIFALDNVERGQKVYRSSQDDLRRARELNFELTDKLLQEGRRECYRIMQQQP